jgi:FtsH-binding integral membrane protein
MDYSIKSSYGAVANAPAEVRADFIRRVYNLFFLSILVTVGVGWFCAQPTVAPALLAALPILLIGEFVCIIALMFARRTTGLNVFLLYLFAAIQGAVLGPVLTMLNHAAPGVPAQAAVLTAAVFGGLSLYALQSRRDFSFLGGFLFVALIGLVVTGIVMFFVHAQILYMIYTFAGVLIFSGYVLYDTSVILRRLGQDEAVVGAISLYLDLLNLFWFILQLLMEFNDRRN